MTMTANDPHLLARHGIGPWIGAAALAATVLACGGSTNPPPGGEGGGPTGGTAGDIVVTPRGGPSPTPSVRVIKSQDEQGDGLSCATGEPADGALPAHLDMGEVSVEILGNEYIWAVSLPGIGSLTTVVNEPGTVFSGGIGIRDPTAATPAPDPDIFFRSAGNFSFGFQWDASLPDMRYTPLAYGNGGWETPQGSAYRLRSSFLANTLRLRISTQAVPEGATWFVWTSDGQICDVHGIEAGAAVLAFP
jgi:hypothetical protein